MERSMSIARLAGIFLLACSAVASSALIRGQSESFNKPIKETVVDLGLSPYYPVVRRVHGQLRCHYFPIFMVKELDWKQKGDDWISIAPNTRAHLTPCSQEHGQSEIVIPPENGLAGYFGGVKANLVFLDAADCFDSGCPFGVFEPFTGKKLFEDSTRLSNTGEISEILFGKNNGNLVMRYPRVVPAECSLPQKKSECWNDIIRTTGLTPQPIPKCIGYSGFNRQEGFGTSDQSDPSVVSFSVEVTIPEFKTHILPGPVTCWAAD
jgi:hypothetical protein